MSRVKSQLIMIYATPRSILLYVIISEIFSTFDLHASVPSASGSLVIAPKDTEVLVGHSTYFNCSTSINDKYIVWYFYPVGGTGIDRKYIYFSGRLYHPYANRTVIDYNGTTGVYNLMIHSVTLEDAGRYDCQDDGGIGETKTAQLIVLAAGPHCSCASDATDVLGRNSCGIEPDQLKLSCSVTYNGNIPPVMEWKSVAENEYFFHYTSYAKEENSVTYNLTLNANSQKNGSSYSCHTTRSTAPTPYYCTSDVFNIAYAFSENSTVNASVGERVICAASTSEVCDYNWKRFVAGSFVAESDGSTLVPKTSGWYRCDAECNIKKRLCLFPTMTAYVFEMEGKQIGLYSSNADLKTILGPVAAVLLLLLITTVIIIFCVRKLKNERNRRQQAEEERKEERNKLQQAEEENKELVTKLKEKYPGAAFEILNGEMFLHFRGSSLISVYGIGIALFEFRRKWSILHLEIRNVIDLVVSTYGRCLFILDNKNKLRNCEIIKIDTEGKVLSRWTTEYTGNGALSTTYDHHVILCTRKISKLIEYSTEGVKVREITYEGVSHLCFCKKLPNNEYLASCEYGVEGTDMIKFKIEKQDLEKKHLTVQKENLVRYFQAWKTKRSSHGHLLFDMDRNGSIYIPDEMGNRIGIFDSEFKNKTSIEGVSGPFALWLDEPNNLIFAYSNDEIILISLSAKLVLVHHHWPEARPEPPK